MELGIRIANALLAGVCDYLSSATLLIFLHCFYDPNLVWTKKKFWLLLPLFLLDIPVTLIGNTALSFVTTLCLPIQLAIMVYDYPGKKLRAAIKVFFAIIVFSAMLSPSLTIGMQYFAPNVDLVTFTIDDTTMLYTNILMAAFMSCVLPYLYKRLYRPGVFIRCGKRERWFLWIYFIVGYVLTAGIEDSFGYTLFPESVITKILAGSLIALAVIVPVFVYASRITEHFVFRTQYQDGYMQTELEHFRQYKQAQEETRRFRHDVKNDLQCLKEMLSAGKTEEARAYLENLVEVAEALGEKYVTGDEILDSILTAKGVTMEQHGIDFQLDGVLAGGLKWKPVDICCVFANAIDNAIEACQQVPKEDRSITLKIKTAPQFWFVRIENPVKEDFDTSLLFHKQGGYTSKADSSRHGIGTYSIKYTTELHGGIVSAQCKDKHFCLEIMIPQ